MGGWAKKCTFGMRVEIKVVAGRTTSTMNALDPRLSRRGFLSTLATAATATAGGLALPGLAQAELVCEDWPGQRVCEAGIPSRLIGTSAIRNEQYQSQWCWAACIAMVFAYHGHPVSQSRIVREAFGAIADVRGTPEMILSQLNRDWVDDADRPFRATSSFGGTTPEAAAYDLVDDHPLIIGTQGHAVVLTSLSYRFVESAYGVVTQLLSAKVRDPWPGVGRRFLRPDEWATINFAAHVRVESLERPIF